MAAARTIAVSIAGLAAACALGVATHQVFFDSDNASEAVPAIEIRTEATVVPQPTLPQPTTTLAPIPQSEPPTSAVPGPRPAVTVAPPPVANTLVPDDDDDDDDADSSDDDD